MNDRLQTRIRELNKQGYGALNLSETGATLIREKQPKHWLHIILVLITGGLWIIPYIYLLGKSRTKIYLEIVGAGLLKERREGGGGKWLFAAYGIAMAAFVSLGITAYLANPLLMRLNASIETPDRTPTEEACGAMSAADFIVDEIENDLYSAQRIPLTRVESLKTAENRIRDLIPQVEGDFKVYMETQASNLSQAYADLRESAAPGSKPGIDEYMKVYNTSHLGFCRD